MQQTTAKLTLLLSACTRQSHQHRLYVSRKWAFCRSSFTHKLQKDTSSRSWQTVVF